MKTRTKEVEAKMEALDRSQAVIEFDLSGKIQDANENFLKTVGYDLKDIQGQHHKMFVEPGYEKTPEYREFWAKLNRGEYDSAEYKRVGKGGKEVWIRATYNPVLNDKGQPFKVVKFATDITDEKMSEADQGGQITAINKAQAVIHFDLNGNILDANENFLKTTGYSLEEIRGKHHRMFVDPEYANSAEYQNFWRKLRSGEFDAGEYKRFGKGGNEVWIQASYNPIFDSNGKPFKVAKFATDITKQKLEYADSSGQLSAINKAQAVIHFDMNGNILDANDNFLGALGYRLDEIKGQHHRMFVEPAFGNSREYADFWAALNRGEYQQAEYKRLGKGGREVWIQASYNPIFDMSGKPFKVVKYATDITGRIHARKEAATSSEETMMSVQTVATAAEELTASVAEISRNTQQLKAAMEQIHAKTKSTDEDTTKLAQATKDMDQIVGMINSIAGQINLLALNATIESARAGEAGRGFAVVAGEVKNLAGQTATATKRISDEIKQVQEVVNKVVGALGEISHTVDSVNEMVGSTAAAIEEQGLVSKEISSNMQKAAEGVSSINDKIAKIANAG